MTALPAPPPLINLDSQPYWAGTLEGRLLLTQCPQCERFIWYPKPLCAACGGTATVWREASGAGTVYSYTVVRRGQGSYADAGPYVVAIVELDEGPRMITNLVDVAPEEVHIGLRVQVDFHAAGEHAALPRFSPGAANVQTSNDLLP